MAMSDKTARNASPVAPLFAQQLRTRRPIMHGLIYLIGLIVVILFILSFLGLR